MKIDSGSELNVIGQDVYQQMLNNSEKKITLQKSKDKLKPYNSPPLQIRGKFRANIESRKHTTAADTYVAASNNVKSILSKYSAFDMNILQISVEELTIALEKRSSRDTTLALDRHV